MAANNGTIEINGGTFIVAGGGDTGTWSDGTSGLADSCINLNARYGAVTCRITGGTFDATAEGASLFTIGTKNAVDLKISGGTFSENLNPVWLETGYVCVADNANPGFFKVVKA